VIDKITPLAFKFNPLGKIRWMTKNINIAKLLLVNIHLFSNNVWSDFFMTNSLQEPLRRILIASANPLFGKGLEKLFAKRWGSQTIEIRLVTSMPETISGLTDWRPDLVIVDYDDRTIDRAEFLNHFVSGDQPMQVMLISLQASGSVVVYDRRTLTPAQAEDWLDFQGRSEDDSEQKDNSIENET
jgi:CheY-like chemotaxis protein